MHKYAKELKEPSKIDGLTHQHKPNSEATLMGVNVKINDFGIRDNFTPRPKEKNEYRILVLGNSITLGWGVQYDYIFTTLFENKLNETYSNLRFEVINSGIGNYNTVMESIYLKSILQDVNPNEIILHFYINDIERISQKKSNFLVKHSYLFAYIYLNFKQSAIINFSNFNSTGKYYLDLYTGENEDRSKAQNAILSINDLCFQNDIKFKVLIQPDLHDLSYDSDQFKCHLIIRKFLENNSSIIKCISSNIIDKNLKTTFNALISTNSMTPKLFGTPLMTKYRNLINDKYLATYVALDLYYAKLFDVNLADINFNKPQPLDFNVVPPKANKENQ